MGWFDLFPTAPRIESVERAVSLSSLTASSAPVSRDAASVLKAYAINPEIARCARFVKNSIGAVKWRAYRVSANSRRDILDSLQDQRAISKSLDKEVTSHRGLDLLNAKSGGQLSAQTLREVIQLHLDLVGEAFVRIVDRSSLLAIVPTQIEKLPTLAEPFWRVRKAMGAGERVPADEIVMIKDPDPCDPYGRGVGLVQAIMQEIESDEQAAETIRTRFLNRGLPQVLIELVNNARQGTPDEVAQSIERHFWSNAQGTGRPMFVGRELKIHTIGQALVDMNVIAIRDSFKQLVRQLYGIPPELLGQVENSNRATIEVAWDIWARNGMVPRLNRFETLYNAILLQAGYNDLIYVYDSPIPNDDAKALFVVEKAPWAVTRDEVRELAGYDRTDDDVGKLVAIPIGTSLEPSDQLTGFSDILDPTPDGQ